MPNFYGNGNASQVGSWQSPLGTAAVALPDVNDLIITNGTLTIDENANNRGAVVEVGKLVVATNRTLTLVNTLSVRNEIEIASGAVLVFQGGLILGTNGFIHGAGILRASGASSRATLNRPMQLGCQLELVSGAIGRLTADISFDGITIANGCTLTLGLGAALRGPVTNNGSIVVDCGAGNTVVIEGTVTGNEPTITSGTLNTSGSPTAATAPGTTADDALAITLGESFACEGVQGENWLYCVVGEGVHHVRLIEAESSGGWQVNVYAGYPGDAIFALNENGACDILDSGNGGEVFICVIGGMDTVSFELIVDSGECP